MTQEQLRQENEAISQRYSNTLRSIKYQVSKETEAFIDVLELSNELYEKVMDATLGIYAEEQLDNVLGTLQSEKGFIKAFYAMRDELEALLLISITESLATSNNTQI